MDKKRGGLRRPNHRNFGLAHVRRDHPRGPVYPGVNLMLALAMTGPIIIAVLIVTFMR